MSSEATKREYKRLRRAGWHAVQAWRHAKTVAEFKSAEFAGHVRLRIEPDDHCSIDDLTGDCFEPRANPDIPRAKLLRQREEFLDHANSVGVWGVIGEYWDARKGAWEQADSCWGFVGEDWKDSGYDADIMHAALEAYEKANEPHLFGFTEHERIMLMDGLGVLALHANAKELQRIATLADKLVKAEVQDASSEG